MFIELIDLLRCPVAHEDSWLVAAFTKMDGRFVREGKLGCPVCSASYLIRGGVAHFAADTAPTEGASGPVDEHELVRAAALLGLTRPGSLVVMAGAPAAGAPQIAELTDSRIFVLNPKARIDETDRVGIVTAGDRMPFAAASVDAILLDEPGSAQIGEAARVLKAGGRVLAPESTNLGPRFTELARDERNVVGESRGPLIGLSR